MGSIWEKNVRLSAFPEIKEDCATDTLVVGGGMTGLLCGYFLQQKGEDYLILEKNRIASGVTGNTTAKITWQHGFLYSKLLRSIGREGAAAYLAAGTQALDAFQRIIEKDDISCDFKIQENCVYSVNNREKKQLVEEADAICMLGGKAVYTERAEIPLQISGMVKTFDQASFHPLKFLSAVASELHIHENSAVKDLQRDGDVWIAQVDNSSGQRCLVRAKRILVATHFPFVDPWGLYFLKLYQQRSYVLALRGTGLPPLTGMYIGTAQGSLSFRSWQDYLILGGYGGRTGKKNDGYEALKAQAGKLFPASRVEAAWATQDCMSLDHVPYIGPYAAHLPGVFVASGYNKWGMTGSMTAALILTDQMDTELTKIFRPNRSILKGQLFLNGVEATKNLLTPTTPRCTHMGCALKWNQQEHSWDCPCHGSRFEKDGNVINDPAQKPI